MVKLPWLLLSVVVLFSQLSSQKLILRFQISSEEVEGFLFSISGILGLTKSRLGPLSVLCSDISHIFQLYNKHVDFKVVHEVRVKLDGISKLFKWLN